MDGDGVIEGLPGTISPELEDVLYAPPDPETGIALGIPFARNELCMWSESGAGPTGYSFVCAEQDDSEFYTGYILDCDENGKITKIRFEVCGTAENMIDVIFQSTGNVAFFRLCRQHIPTTMSDSDAMSLINPSLTQHTGSRAEEQCGGSARDGHPRRWLSARVRTCTHLVWHDHWWISGHLHHQPLGRLSSRAAFTKT